MQHRLLIGFSQEQVEALVEERGLFSFKCFYDDVFTIRERVFQFENMYGLSPGNVLIVDCFGYTESKFSYFLKVLESTHIQGAVWFFNVLLSSVPFTIRSRTIIEIFLNDGSVRYTDKEFCLLEYGKSGAVELLGRREKFVSIMQILDGTKNYNIYKIQVADIDGWFMLLFIEWFMYSPVFSVSELRLCGFLRKVKFGSMVMPMLGGAMPSTSSARLLFDFLFGFKMIST